MCRARFICRGNENVPAELVELLEAPPLRSLVDFLAKMGQLGMAGTLLLGQQPRILKGYEAGQIDRAARIVAGVEGNGGAVPAVEVEEDEETAFRRAEYRALRQARQEEQLTVEVAPLEQYGMDFQRFFDTVGLVTRLRETRALAGFGRVFPPGGQNETGRQRQLRRELPVAGENWLPAYRVYGEGIFLSLREELVRDWEAEAAVVARVRPLLQRFHAVQEARRLRERPLGPRFLLLHTLSHLLINRLTFECGYSTAALRERLYVSADAREPMAGSSFTRRQATPRERWAGWCGWDGRGTWSPCSSGRWQKRDGVPPILCVARLALEAGKARTHAIWQRATTVH